MIEKLMFSIEDVSEMTGLSKSCIYKLTANRVVDFYKPFGKKIFFSKEQILNFLTKTRVRSLDEISVGIDNQISLSKKCIKK